MVLLFVVSVISMTGWGIPPLYLVFAQFSQINLATLFFLMKGRALLDSGKKLSLRKEM